MRVFVELAIAVALTATAHQLGTYLAAGTPATSGWIFAVVAALVAGVFGILEIVSGVSHARAEEKRIRRRILTHIFTSESLPKNDSDQFSSAKLIQLMTDNAERLTDFRQQYLGSTLAALLTPVLLVGYIAVGVDLWLGLGMAISIPLVPLLVGGFMRVFRGVSARSRAERAKLTTQYLDAIRNLTAVRLFGAGPRLETTLRAQGEKNRRAIMRILAGNQIVIIVLDGVFSLVFICWSVLLISWGIDAGRIDITEALTALFLLVLLLEPLNQVAGFFYIGMGGIAAQRAIKRYLEQHPLPEAQAGVESAADTSHAAIDPADTHLIDVHDVTYDYGRGEVLHNARLHVDAGEKVAVMGPSGAGKSTLLGLLKGSLPMQEGSITISGKALANLSPAEIRKLAASVSQTTWLFTGTIADNLRLVHKNATEEDMWAALERAHVAHDIRRMPEGLNTDVGERGSRLSGGQAQRISLARAFLSGRDIVFLDEPTSHVDVESEAHIIDAIEQIGEELTVVMVTHRDALLRIADKLYTVTDGTVTEGARS
ncbi:ATP-binding cassette domain-containing protein [Arcanobacterium phocisimile]|uniref:ATP-binding cassette domain-containing protein n=2 Tax=Arcanobacterium phocisimile TaxID=1302235 RepID=A0ABX7IIN2_9ACTO|nr:ATP-binding cassette domain-containing protein [Arcanobacterium phocisimile]